MADIKISVSKFEKIVKDTSDHVWYGILKREFWDRKYTVAEWRQVLESLKRRPA